MTIAFDPISPIEKPEQEAMLTVATAALAFNTVPLRTVSRTAAVRMSSVDDGADVLLEKFGLPAPELEFSRRTAINLGLAAAAVAPLAGFSGAAFADDGMFSVPPLPYAYDALEPHVDAATMKFRACCARRSPLPPLPLPLPVSGSRRLSRRATAHAPQTTTSTTRPTSTT